jgi:hypothetical protein
MKAIFIQENMLNILKPKSDAEIQEILKKYNLKYKLDIIRKWYFLAEDLINELVKFGIDPNHAIKTILKYISREELSNFILEDVYDIETQEQLIEIIIQYIKEDNFEKILNNLISIAIKENPEELEDIVNRIIVANQVDLRKTSRYY